ncbi:manganese catalase family protein, partial [Burkholderia multivorans]|uniref:manganese catalase family protein n=1 Tax=Burkholderia multivorans TaxID=87883 RepID=UPI003BF52376
MLGIRRNRRPLTHGGFMFIHNTRLQYTVRVDAPNPGLANLLLEQFGGPQGELAAG